MFWYKNKEKTTSYKINWDNVTTINDLKCVCKIILHDVMAIRGNDVNNIKFKEFVIQENPESKKFMEEIITNDNLKDKLDAETKRADYWMNLYQKEGLSKLK